MRAQRVRHLPRFSTGLPPYASSTSICPRYSVRRHEHADGAAGQRSRTAPWRKLERVSRCALRLATTMLVKFF